MEVFRISMTSLRVQHGHLIPSACSICGSVGVGQGRMTRRNLIPGMYRGMGNQIMPAITMVITMGLCNISKHIFHALLSYGLLLLSFYST